MNPSFSCLQVSQLFGKWAINYWHNPVRGWSRWTPWHNYRQHNCRWHSHCRPKNPDQITAVASDGQTTDSPVLSVQRVYIYNLNCLFHHLSALTQSLICQKLSGFIKNEPGSLKNRSNLPSVIAQRPSPRSTPNWTSKADRGDCTGGVGRIVSCLTKFKRQTAQ